MSFDEFARIATIAEILGTPRGGGMRRADPAIALAIGDDAAVIDPAGLAPGETLVWTIDAAVENVHFRAGWLSMEDLGYRAVVAAASDLLAMGARPIAALSAWTLPPETGSDLVEGIARGQRLAADALGLTIAGGNLCDGPLLSLTTTALGAVVHPVRRDGARPGDKIVLSGVVGEAALGWRCIAAGRPCAPDDDLPVARWRRPPILLREAFAMRQLVRAMIDVSDGLAQDIGHVCLASGVRGVISLEALAAQRRPDALELASRMGLSLVELELAGGEDYSLVAALDPGALLPAGAVVIGRFEEGMGVWLEGAAGERTIAPTGHRHGTGTGIHAGVG